MRKFLASFGLALVFFFSILFPAQSGKVSLDWPVEGELGVKFGEKYQVEGEEKTHLGVDILASEGTEIRSPAEGEVSFAGQVAGRLAVTINIEGYKVSLSPLQEVLVLKGEKVSSGKIVGKLAAEGDYSSKQPHLHLSLRDPSGKYLDPLFFLPPLIDERQIQEQPQLQTQEQPQLQLQEQPISNEIVVNPEPGGELSSVPNLNQLPDQAEANQLQRDIQVKSHNLRSARNWRRASQRLLTKERSILQMRRPVENFGSAKLKKGVNSFCLTTRVELKNKNKSLLNGFNQHQPLGLAELTELSKRNSPISRVQSSNGDTNFNLGYLLHLGWSFLVLFLVYFVFCLAEKGSSNFWLRLAEA